MKILLIQPPWGEAYGSFREAAKIGNAYPPLGLCYLSAVLKKEGHQTKIIDVEMESLTGSEIVKKTRRYKPGLVGFTATTPIFHLAKDLATEIKKIFPQVPVIIGGPHLTALPRKTFSEARMFDYGVYGEGEKTIVELVRFIYSRRPPLRSIKGILYRNKKGKTIINPPRPLIGDLNKLPFPDRKGLKLDKYFWSVPGRGILKFTTFITSRGCPFNCIFCSTHTVFGKRVRERAVKNVLDEIEYLVKELKINHLSFMDDTLTFNRGRVIKICQGVIERGLNFTWECVTRANTVDKELLTIMHQAGLVRISFGIESGDPKILKLIKKGVTLAEMKKAYKIAKEVGLETRGSVMLGHPFETRKTAMRTLEFIKGLKNCDQMHINITTPYPGTELYRMAQKNIGGIRLLTDDFSQFKRYDGAAIEVNDLTKEDLSDLQRKGLRMFYFSPRRVVYNLRRAGIKAALVNSWAFFKGTILSRGRTLNKRNLPRYLKAHTWFLDKLGSLKGKRTIDVGCGEGFFLGYLQKRYGLKRIIGLDIDPVRCQTARRLNPNTAIIEADAQKIPFDDKSFDFVFVNAILHHVEHPYQVVKELIRVSKNNCLISIVEPRRFHPAIFLISLFKPDERGLLRLKLKKLLQFLSRKETVKEVEVFPVNSFIYPYQRFPPVTLLKTISRLEDFFNHPFCATHQAIVFKVKKEK